MFSLMFATVSWLACVKPYALPPPAALPIRKFANWESKALGATTPVPSAVSWADDGVAAPEKV